jgi:hypothetical protein
MAIGAHRAPRAPAAAPDGPVSTSAREARVTPHVTSVHANETPPSATHASRQASAGTNAVAPRMPRPVPP